MEDMSKNSITDTESVNSYKGNAFERHLSKQFGQEFVSNLKGSINFKKDKAKKLDHITGILSSSKLI